MKKYLIIVIIVFLSFKSIVYGKTYYGEYKFIGYDELQINDEVKREDIKLYNTYSIEYQDMGYLEESEIYFKDENDFKYEEIYKEEHNVNNEELISIGISEYETNTITLKNILLGMEIGEIKIFNNNEEIKYSVNCNLVTMQGYLYDNNLETYSTLLTGDSYIKFNLENSYNIHDLSIFMYTRDKQNNLKINLYLNNQLYLFHMNTNKKHLINFNNSNETKKLYKDKVKLYRYYKPIKKVENIYVIDGNNLLLDDYKYIYKYYKRDKLILSDNYIIDNNYKSVFDFIDYSSSNVEVISDINYDIPGEYECIYILNDIKVKKIIKVMEKEDVVDINIVDEKKEDIIDINVVKDKVSKEDKKELYKEYNVVDNQKEEIEEKNEIKLKKEIYKDESKVVNNKGKVFILKYIILLLFIAIEIILFIRKRKRKKRIVESV